MPHRRKSHAGIDAFDGTVARDAFATTTPQPARKARVTPSAPDALLALHPHALFTAEADVITYATGAWLTLTGRTPQDVTGEHLSTLLPVNFTEQSPLEAVAINTTSGPKQVRVSWRTEGNIVAGSIEPLAPSARRVFELEHELSAKREQLHILIRTFGRAAGVEERHVERVAHHARRVGEAMRLSEAELEALEFGAWLHDVGKARLTRDVLRKCGPLSESEREQMRLHPQWGVQVISDLTFLPWTVYEIVVAHHERYDGGGYPYGLEGESIPLLARIVAICDVFDALTSDRAYRPALSVPDALNVIRQERGKHFCPRVTDAFLELFA